MTLGANESWKKPYIQKPHAGVPWKCQHPMGKVCEKPHQNKIYSNKFIFHIEKYWIKTGQPFKYCGYIGPGGQI